MLAQFLDLNNRSWHRRPFALSHTLLYFKIARIVTSKCSYEEKGNPEVNPILRISLSNDGRKVWTTVLFLSTIMFQKVIQSCQFFFFFVFLFCHICRTTDCWDPEILLPLQRDVTTSPLYGNQEINPWCNLKMCLCLHLFCTPPLPHSF